MKIFSEKDILHALIGLNGWDFQDNSLKKTFTFDSYMQSIEFINRVAEKAEIVNHHPDMEVGWCKIRIAFTSHDLGGVTASCIEMAKQVDSVL